MKKIQGRFKDLHRNLYRLDDEDCCCPRRDFAHKAKSRGGTLVTHAYILAVEIYSQYARKISISLNRGHKESVGNDDVSIVHTRKYEMVRMK